jgi:DNA-binding MarR family transcriptional regulator
MEERPMTDEQPESGHTTERAELISHFQSVFGILDWQSTRIKEQLLAPFHLTVPQVTVLLVLRDEGREVETPSIASKAGLPPGTVSSILDRLFLRRLVQRREVTANGRRIIVGTITDDGKELLLQLDVQRTRLFEELVALYSDKELEQLLDLFLRWTAQGDRLIPTGNQDQRQPQGSPASPIARRRAANVLRDFPHRRQ